MAASVVLSFLTSGVSKVMGALAGLGKAAGGLMKGLSALGQGMKKMAPAGLALTGVFAGLTYAIMSIGKSILATGQTFDGFRAKFKALYKDITRATEAMNEAIEIAARTPFKVQDVVDVFGAFKAVGLDPTSMLNGKVVMEDMADLAYGMGRSLQDAQWAIKEAAAEGSWRSLMMRFSISKEQIMSTLEAANITPDLSNPTKALETIRKYIQLQFGGTMEAMAQTVEVKISNIGDQFNQFKDLIYTSGVSDALVGVLDKVLKTLERFFKGETGQAWAKNIGATFEMLLDNLMKLAPLGKRVLGAIWSMMVKIVSATVRAAVLMWKMGEPIREIYKWVFKLLSTYYRLLYLSGVLWKRSIQIFTTVEGGSKKSLGLFMGIRRVLEFMFDKTMSSLRMVTGWIENLNRGIARITGQVTDMSQEERAAGSVWEEILGTFDSFKEGFDSLDFDRHGSGLDMIKTLLGGAKDAMGGTAEEAERLAEAMERTAELTDAQRADYILLQKNILTAKDAIKEGQKELEKASKEWRRIHEEQIGLTHSVEDMVDSFRDAKGLMSDEEKDIKAMARAQELLVQARGRQDLEGEKAALEKMAEVVRRRLKDEAELEKTIREAKDPREAWKAERELAKRRAEWEKSGGSDLGLVQAKIERNYIEITEQLQKKSRLALEEAKDETNKAREALEAKKEGANDAMDAMKDFLFTLGDKVNPQMLDSFTQGLERFLLQEEALKSMGVTLGEVSSGLSKIAAISAGGGAVSPTLQPELFGQNVMARRYGRHGALVEPDQRLVELGEQQLEQMKADAEERKKANEEAKNPVSPVRNDGLEAFSRNIQTLPMF